MRETVDVEGELEDVYAHIATEVRVRRTQLERERRSIQQSLGVRQVFAALVHRNFLHSGMSFASGIFPQHLERMILCLSTL